MKNPKVMEKWIVDLSPTRGAELGGVRKCLVLDVFSPNLIQIVPYSAISGYDNEPMFEHTRSVDISRFKERVAAARA
jgi:hypothetical protein